MKRDGLLGGLAKAGSPIHEFLRKWGRSEDIWGWTGARMATQTNLRARKPRQMRWMLIAAALREILSPPSGIRAQSRYDIMSRKNLWCECVADVGSGILTHKINFTSNRTLISPISFHFLSLWRVHIGRQALTTLIHAWHKDNPRSRACLIKILRIEVLRDSSWLI